MIDINVKYKQNLPVKQINNDNIINYENNIDYITMLIDYKTFKEYFKLEYINDKSDFEIIEDLQHLIDFKNIDDIIQDINYTFGDAEDSDKYIRYELLNKDKYDEKISEYMMKKIDKLKNKLRNDK